ncbi:MAG: DUF4266 domain-containing protein [Gammaproteobacteria bacterium]|nr:DUF4266 domain-containing protein [Gammaproteobacteria bacterium]MDH3435143.1 DUF4266 domain-containing protein [Gammaproteobacteria bacterium]
MQVRLLLEVLLLAGIVSGCTSMGVEPWERDILARDEMQLTTDAVEAATDDHIYFSKEASSGGRGFGGGGCGCN